MSMWTDDLDVDMDLYGDEEDVDGEDLGDWGEDVDWESDGEDIEALTPAQRRRRARIRQTRRARYRRLRQLGAARRARARGRARAVPSSPGAVVARTREAVEKVDLENKVQADETAAALAAQSRRADASENAAVANAVVGPLASTIGTFSDDLGKNPFVKIGLPLSPLLFLRPRRKGRGVASLASDKRVWAVGAVVGLTIAQTRRENDKRAVPVDVTISPSNPQQIPAGQPLPFRAKALDSRGNPVSTAEIEWVVTPSNLASVDANGVVTTKKSSKGKPLLIKATVKGTQLATFVTVEPQ